MSPNDGLKEFFMTQITELKDSLQAQAQQDRDQLTKNISKHLSYMEEKLTEKSARPHFKNKFNAKHYDRVQTYKVFLQEAKYGLDNGNLEDAQACINTCIEAIAKYQKDIVIADGSPCGWELIERISEGPVDRDVVATERRILEERKAAAAAKKRTDERERTEGVQGPSRSAQNPRSFGPCIWCGGQGHGYKHCSVWKADVQSGKAIYDTNARKWVFANAITYEGDYAGGHHNGSTK